MLFDVLLAGALAQGEPRYDEEAARKFAARILANETREEWKKIRWRAGMEEALREARKEQNPLFVLFVVGEGGRRNAPRC